MQELSFVTQLALSCLAVGVLGWMLVYQRRKWVPVGRLQKIFIYPIKSGKVRELSEAECTPLGLKWSGKNGNVALRDRAFVVFDQRTKEFISGKNYKNITFITIEPKTANSVIFSYPGKEDLELDLAKFDHFNDFILMWFSEKIRSVDCGDKIAKWMSEVVRGQESGLRLGFWPEGENWRRDVVSLRTEEIVVYKKLSNKFSGAYSDLSSYLLLSKNSVDDLNSKLEESNKVSAVNFRPNLLIEGVDAYAEDKWDCIKIGEVVFQNFRPCTRCIFTTMNPNTGEKNKSYEPLRTLKTYRTMRMLGDEKVEPNESVMGSYVGLVQQGTIKTGDTVYILK